jgi:acyl carrier protein
MHKDVRQILLKWFKKDDAVILDTKLSDLPLDSMDFVELLFDLEEKFNVYIEASDMDMSQTLSTFIDSVIQEQENNTNNTIHSNSSIENQKDIDSNTSLDDTNNS